MRDPTIGKTIGEYEIVDFLARGGMGDVYLAKQKRIGKKIAIKSLKLEFTRDKEMLQRFMREAEAVNKIQHENLIDIFNFVQEDNGRCYILMEYLEGQSLSSLIREEAPLPVVRIGHIGLQLCSALSAAHEKGVLHRDLKPDNIILTNRSGQEDFVKVVDFGLAKLQERSGVDSFSVPGIPMGTPAYMSPEQAAGEPVDAGADIYALGIILYEMATKTLPFFSLDMGALLRKQMVAELPAPRSRFAGVSAALEAVIIKSLEKERDRRYGSMYEFASALSQACGLDLALYFGGTLASVRGAPAVSRQSTTTKKVERISVNSSPKPAEHAEATWSISDLSSTVAVPKATKEPPGVLLDLMTKEYTAVTRESKNPESFTAVVPTSQRAIYPRSKARPWIFAGAALLLLLLGAGLFFGLPKREEQKELPPQIASPMSQEIAKAPESMPTPTPVLAPQGPASQEGTPLPKVTPPKAPVVTKIAPKAKAAAPTVTKPPVEVKTPEETKPPAESKAPEEIKTPEEVKKPEEPKKPKLQKDANGMVILP